MLETLLILSILALVYVYAGYPLLVLALAALAGRGVRKGPCHPSVTILIAAFDEEDHVGATVQNKLDLDYPGDKLEIIVVSDGSSDRTDEIVRGFRNRGVLLIRQEPRQGKTAALNRGVAQASGEIIVFADANSIYETHALSRLTENFEDPEVGYVTGKMIYVDPDGSVVGDGCSAYMKYENFLRSCETRVGSVVGVDGGIDAVRKGLYRPMNADQLPDFVLPMQVVAQGRRVVYEPAAILEERTLSSSADEYRMRVRVALRSLWAMHDMRQLFNFARYGLFSWQLLSHKVLRYAAFVFLVLAFVSNLLLWNEGAPWKALLLAQIAAYGVALVTWRLSRKGYEFRLLSLPYYFTLLNLASAHAFLRYVLGHKQVLWTPRKG